MRIREGSIEPMAISALSQALTHQDAEHDAYPEGKPHGGGTGIPTRAHQQRRHDRSERPRRQDPDDHFSDEPERAIHDTSLNFPPGRESLPAQDWRTRR